MNVIMRSAQGLVASRHVTTSQNFPVADPVADSDSGVDLHDTRGVTRLDGALGKAPSCLNLRSYGSKFTVLKEVFVTLLGIFGAPRSHSAPT